MSEPLMTEQEYLENLGYDKFFSLTQEMDGVCYIIKIAYKKDEAKFLYKDFFDSAILHIENNTGLKIKE